MTGTLTPDDTRPPAGDPAHPTGTAGDAPEATGRRRAARRRGQPWGTVLSEAWRNLTSGTTRATAFALLLALTAGLLAWADVSAVDDVAERAVAFRAAGADVLRLQAPAAVDGRACQAQTRLTGVEAAGALRSGAETRLTVLPGTTVSTFQVTPGLVDVVAGDGASTVPGVWLSADLAATLGAHPGDTLRGNHGTMTVAGSYPYPSDGRDQQLANAILVPTAPTGAFDACWTRVWPTTAAVQPLLLLPVDGSATSADSPPQTSQLNPTPGTTFDAAALLDQRTTRYAPWAALVVGLALGFVAVRLRRLELASARHAGTRVVDQLAQVLVETALWALAAAVLAAAPVAWVAGASHDPAVSWQLAARIVACAVAGALLGALVATALTRESHLFRYFKDR